MQSLVYVVYQISPQTCFRAYFNFELQETLKKLHDFNCMPENYNQSSSSSDNPKDKSNIWGGEKLCTMLEAAYHLAHLCLLRVDEVLKIQHHHIERITDTKFKLTLPFRKTHQFGGWSQSQPTINFF
jgi:hypothetical protein